MPSNRLTTFIVIGLVLGLIAGYIVGIPTMFAATAYEAFDLYQSGQMAQEHWGDLAAGFVVSSIVVFIAVKWLLRYVQTHQFTPFAWYRIVFGALLLAVI